MCRTNTSAVSGIGAEFGFARKMSGVAQYENVGKVIDGKTRTAKAWMVSVGQRCKF